MAITVPPPTNPLCQVRATANQTLANTNQFYTVFFPGEDVDDGGSHSTAPGFDHFVGASRTGLYQVSGAVLFSTGQTVSGTAANNARALRLAYVRSGTTYGVPASTVYASYSGSALTVPIGPLLVPLVAGDEIRLQVNTYLANTVLAASNDEGSYLRVDFVR